MNEDEQVIWGQPVSFLDFVLGFLVTPNQRRVEFIPKADPLKFYVREKVTPPSQDLEEIRDANKERVNRSLSNYASNNFLLSTSNIRPDLNGRYNPGLGLFAGDLTALTLSMGFDPFNASNYYKVAALIPKFRNWGLTRLLANELNNEVRVAGELGKNVGSVPKTLFVFPLFKNVTRTVQDNGKIRLSLPSHTDTNPRQFVLEPLGNNKFYVHMRTWDGDHIPANLSNGDKLTLFQALYDELPEGGEILFPKSGPGYYGTRGTVAGLLRLSRDSRFSPGTKGTLLYVDKDGTIKTYEGTSFIKKSVLEPKTSLRFFERPLSRISEAERAGIPKGERAINDPKVLENAKQFAEKYGYKVPTTVEEAKNMYKTHNRFFRSINMEPFEKAYPEFGIFPEKEFPELVGLTREEKLKTLASKGYPRFWRTHDLNDIGSGFSDDFVFVSPSLAENAAYANSMGTNFSNTVMLLRPFSFGKPTEWHINADWRPSLEVFGRIHRKGEVSIGNSPLKNEAKVSTKHLIPVKIALPGDLGTTLGDFLYKQKYNLK